MIRKLPLERGFRLTCSKCGREESLEAYPWSAFMALAKSRGWRFTKTNGAWQHFCAACVKEWAERQNNNPKPNSPKNPKPGYPCPECQRETFKTGVPMYDKKIEGIVYYHPDCFLRTW